MPSHTLYTRYAAVTHGCVLRLRLLPHVRVYYTRDLPIYRSYAPAPVVILIVVGYALVCSKLRVC